MKKGICTKLIIFYSFSLGSITTTFCQIHQWTWVKGDNTPGIGGIYGTKGVASPDNKPGSRRLSVSWTDTSGKFWLFGGNGYDKNGDLGYLNDLWLYDPSIDAWTWMSGDAIADVPGEYGVQGVSSITNQPGSRRRSTSWVDKTNNLWLFGGNGYDGVTQASYLNDLWRYNITTNQWTWVKGDTLGNALGTYGTQGVGTMANKPGARYAASSWTDVRGSLWLFGGLNDRGNGQEKLNDLWVYDITNNQWTWMKGSNTGEAGAVYGTKGVASLSVTPGASAYNITWKESENDLWMFGGGPNSLWKFNTVTNEWTWVNGDSTETLPNYGVKGNSSPTNRPGSRSAGISWKDSAGNLWMFGGEEASTTDFGYLNDLWKYTQDTNEWTWIKGDSTINVPAVYGTKGISDTSNNPGARQYGVGWKDNNDNFWLFGGDAYYSTNESDYLNDLWKYNPTNYTTVANGNWNNPATWADGSIPPTSAHVIIRNTVTVTVNASCNSLKVEPPGQVVVSRNVDLSILH